MGLKQVLSKIMYFKVAVTFLQADKRTRFHPRHEYTLFLLNLSTYLRVFELLWPGKMTINSPSRAETQ